jgi:FKBP-type peptidyl-prolyl cis-trans isomerase
MLAPVARNCQKTPSEGEKWRLNMLRLGTVLISLALLVAAPSLAASPAKAKAKPLDPTLSLAANKAFLDNYAKLPGVNRQPSGLMYRIIHKGFGRRPAPYDYTSIYYTGKLINGTVFDGTEPGMPYRERANRNVPGMVEALTLMRTHDHWEVVIPAQMAYGDRGAGEVIPPNQTLIFDIEIETVYPPKSIPHAPDENPDKIDDNQDLGPDENHPYN